MVTAAAQLNATHVALLFSGGYSSGEACERISGSHHAPRSRVLEYNEDIHPLCIRV